MSRGRPVFLDRDGTVIEDRHFLGRPEGVALLPGAGEAIARLNRAGLPVYLVTNQSGIGRGYFTEGEFQAVQARLEGLLYDAGARLSGVYHCPHAPDLAPPCDCRKPRTGLFRRAAAEHHLALDRAFFIGDRARDVVPALELGGTGVLIGAVEPDEKLPPSDALVRMPSLADAVTWVLGRAALD